LDPNLSPGQLYVLLALLRGDHSEDVAKILPDLFLRFWKAAPYHLRLDLLCAAQFCARAPAAVRQSLIDCLQGLPEPQHIFLSTTLIEALQALGAFEESEREHIDVVRDQIRRAL